MIKVKVLFIALLAVLLLAFTVPPKVFAAEITTEPEITEEVITTAVEDIEIIIEDDKIIIGGFELSKDEAIAFLSDVLEVYAGDLLTVLGIPAAILASLLVGLLIFGLKKLTDYIKELRAAKQTNQGISYKYGS